jgi:phosphatidylinositol alpha 1,6-mannosyltransferase
MRILIVTEHLLPLTGGIGTTTDALVKAFSAAGHLVRIVAPDPGTDARAGADYGVDWTASVPVKDDTSFRLALPSARSTAVLEEFRPDVLLAINPLLLGARAIGAARAAGVPVVSSYHTDPLRFGAADPHRARSLFADAARENHRASDANVAPSVFARRTLDDWGCDRVAVIGHGVDTALFRPAPGQVRAGPLRVGWIGRLSEEKRPDLLAGIVRDRRVRLTVVGDGPLRAGLERAMPAAEFAGTRGRAELAELYRSFDVVVHTCGIETFGLTVLEAQASGCAVIVAAEGGAAELVEPNATGLIAAAQTPEAYGAALDRLLRNPGLLAGVRRGAAQSARTRTWASAAEEFTGVLRPIAENGRHR